MESSLRSSLHLEDLRGDSLIWTSKQIDQNLSQHYLNSSQEKLQQKIINAQKEQQLKLQMHLLNKPNYGSLGQFMTDINLGSDYFKQKKKKNDIKDYAEQERLKKSLQNQDLSKILTNAQSSFEERKTASKLLIEKSFEEAFGSSITDFQQNQIKKVESENKICLNLNSLSNALDEIVNRSTETHSEKSNSTLNYIKQNMRKNRYSNRNKTCFSNQREEFLKKINDLKNSYRSLQKSQIPQNPPLQYIELQQKSSNNMHYQHPLIKQQRSFHYNSLNYQKNLKPDLYDDQIFIINSTCLVICNLNEISTESILYLISNIDSDLLEEVSIIKSTFLNIDSFFFLLDTIGIKTKKLKSLVIQKASQIFQDRNRDKFTQKIKRIVQNASSTLLMLKLNNLGLETKHFCILCLAIGSTQILQCVQMKFNNIDEHAKKSFDIIKKFFSSLQIDLQGNSIQNQIVKSKLKGSKQSLKRFV